MVQMERMVGTVEQQPVRIVPQPLFPPFSYKVHRTKQLHSHVHTYATLREVKSSSTVKIDRSIKRGRVALSIDVAVRAVRG